MPPDPLSNTGGVQFSFGASGMDEAAKRKIALEEQRKREEEKKRQEEQAGQAGGAIGATAGALFGLTPWGAALGGPAVTSGLGGGLGKMAGSFFG